MPRKKITTVKDLRTAQKLSQAAFAKTIDVSTASVGAYETGRANPSQKVLGKILEVYGVSLTPKPAKKVKRAKKAAADKPKAKRGRKPKAEKAAAAVQAEIVLQSALGGTVTLNELIAKVGPVDKIYIRADQNKAYWVKGEENGSVDLW